jgi:hypothetical protein
MNRNQLRPLAITAVTAMTVTTGLFFAGAARADNIATGGTVSVRLGALLFLRLAKQHTSSGSSVTVTPGGGLALIWGFLLAYGLIIALLRSRSTHQLPDRPSNKVRCRPERPAEGPQPAQAAPAGYDFRLRGHRGQQ